MKMNANTILKKHLLDLISGEGAHLEFEKAIEGFDSKNYGKSIKKIPYSPWQLLEHIRLAQKDILEYIANPDYETPKWPEDYWPKQKAPPTKKSWQESVKQFRQDSIVIKKMLKDSKTDLFAAIPFVKKGPRYLREILLIVDHNSYHMGQMVLMRRLLGNWKH